MNTKSSIKRTVSKLPKLALPTLAAFAELSFKRKAQVFRDWAATMNGSYDSISSEACALSQFSAAIGGRNYVNGSSYGIYNKNGDHVPVLLERDFDEYDFPSPIHGTRRGGLTTFQSLAKRLDIYITKRFVKMKA